MELHNYQMMRRIQQDRADIGISTAPAPYDGFFEIPLFKEPIVVYLSPNHPLFAKNKLQPSDIVLDELLLTEDGKSMLKQLEKMQEQEGIAVNNTTRSTRLSYLSGSTETIRKIIELSGGITLLPATSVYYMGERRKAYVRYFEDLIPSRPICLLTQRGVHKQRLIDVVRAELQLATKQLLDT